MSHRVIPLALLAAALFAAPAHAGKCPNLLIVLDRSGSMGDAPDNSFPVPPGGSKWDLAGKALQKLVTDYDGRFPMGLSLFASDNSCGAAKLDVPPDYNTGMQILKKIQATSPNSSTPTAEAIKSMAAQKELRDPSRGQYILLITDGSPNCSDLAPPSGTVKALSDAYAQNPSITTFVVGFGRLPAAEANAMDKMADAGGKPLMGMQHKFYAADSLDSLSKAIDDIVQVVTFEGMATCDDSCYAVGCPNPGDMCIRGVCQQNPCASVTCSGSNYCYTDGVSPGTCVPACKKACPKGYRCEMGRCIQDPCGNPCVAGFVCNGATKQCEPDPLCPPDRPVKDQCKRPSQCQFGKCVDDPCVFIKCPAQTHCIHWNGTCDLDANVNGSGPDMGAGIDTGDTASRGGCSAGADRQATGGSVLAALLMTLLLLRQRRRSSRRA